MKRIKSYLLLLFVLVLLLCAFPLTSFAVDKCKTCGSDLTGEKRFTQPTCTEPGYVIYVCSNPKCEGEKKQNEPAAGHKWTDKAEDKYVKDPAYCKGPATYYKSCSVCGASAKGNANADKLVFNGPADQIDKNNHRNIDVKIPGEPATCTKEGKTGIGTCKDCQTPYVGGAVIPKLPHTEGTPANCVDKAICKVCKQSYGEPNPKNHKSVKTDPAKQATCKATGLTEGSHCEACKTTIKAQETVPLAAHTPTTKNVPATCTKDGVLNEMTCAVCGEIITAGTVLPKTGHKWGNWSGPTGYSCANGGTVTRVCNVCKEKETKTLSAGEHTLAVDEAVAATCTKDGKTSGAHCSVCGEIFIAQAVIPASGHRADANGFATVKAASCEKAGEEKATCGVCGQSFTREIPATGHNYKVGIVPPTCTAEGYDFHRCSVCGYAYTDHITAPAGHKWGKWKPFRSSDPNEKGIEVRFCTVCGAYEVREEQDGGQPINAAEQPKEQDETPAENLNFFQRIIQWFRNLFARLFGR
ncbi:MAG: hypothetical protein IJU56_07080 [Clostridia bacterium]|nr:hypothetical protein [Clostridia bacterium]